MFSEQLKIILNELNNHHNDRAKLIEYYINKRLTDSLSVYYDTLEKSIRYLSDKDEKRLLKKIGDNK